MIPLASGLALLHVCRESFGVGAGNYSRIFEPEHSIPNTWIHGDVDLVAMGWWQDYDNESHDSKSFRRTDTEKARHFCILWRLPRLYWTFRVASERRE